ncbi:MAG: hypothetical protein ACYDEN_14870, partial [Acidimicrobiales bacterium]
MTTDGKFFRCGGTRFYFKGVTYGTFRPREEDGARFPDRNTIKRDLAAIDAAGFTVLRTYTVPPVDLLEIAADFGLKVLAGVFYPDWRYLVGTSRRQRRGVATQARSEVIAATRRLAGIDHLI